MSTKWFKVLATHLPTDPGISSCLGEILSKQDDGYQGFHYQLEFFQNWPVNVDVISWLGFWIVKSKKNENIIHFFYLAVKINPNKVK